MARLGDKSYRSGIAPRLLVVNDRLREMRDAIKSARKALRARGNSPALLAETFERQRTDLNEAHKQMKGVGKHLTRHLAAILRRGRLERLLIEIIHAILLLALFTLGFEWIGDSICEWTARLIAIELPPHSRACRLVWFAVTLVLFALERWFLGPLIDGRIDKWIRDSTLKGLASYYLERTSMEYRLTTIEHVLAKNHEPLKRTAWFDVP